MVEGDADEVEDDEERINGDSGALRPVLGVSLAFPNRFSNEYFEPSLLVARGGSGSASCPADHDLRELVRCERTRSLLQM